VLLPLTGLLVVFVEHEHRVVALRVVADEHIEVHVVAADGAFDVAVMGAHGLFPWFTLGGEPAADATLLRLDGDGDALPLDVAALRVVGLTLGGGVLLVDYLDGMLDVGGRVHLDGVLAVEHAQVVVHGFREHRVLGRRRARAEEALAKAQSEIAARGLVVTVVQAYYGFVVAQRRYATAQRAAGEAERFFDVTQKLERGGEVAHSDSIKAELQYRQQQRNLQDAQLEMDRSRLELAVLIFPNFNENFATVDDLENIEPLPSFDEVESQAGDNNPQLRVALASLKAANQEVAVAWNSFLPSLGLDYFYGIDASHYAANGSDPVTGRQVKNLGYAATATLELPLWNWGASRSKVKQADLLRDQAKVELSFAQRKAAADLKTLYSEAVTSRSELESLRQSADLASESLRLITLRYQAGEATVLEVVDAQNTLSLAQNALGDGQERFRVAVANLQTLTGKF